MRIAPTIGGLISSLAVILGLFALLAITQAFAADTGPPGRWGPDLPRRPAPVSVTTAAGLVTGAAPSSVIGDLIKQGLIPKIIADLQTLDTVAGAVNPKSTLTAPFNTYLPEAHMCIAAAVPWLQALPSLATLPTPKGDGGAFTTLGMAEIAADATQDFLNSLTAESLKPIKIACAAWAQRVVTTPATLAANANKDLFSFLTIFAH